LKTLAYLIEHRDGRIPYNLNIQNIEGNTPLHTASSYGHHAIVSYLLSLPAEDLDRNAVNHEGQTALMLAVNDGHK
jgi:ankyrin repeat protein